MSYFVQVTTIDRVRLNSDEPSEYVAPETEEIGTVDDKWHSAVVEEATLVIPEDLVNRHWRKKNIKI